MNILTFVHYVFTLKLFSFLECGFFKDCSESLVRNNSIELVKLFFAILCTSLELFDVLDLLILRKWVIAHSI